MHSFPWNFSVPTGTFENASSFPRLRNDAPHCLRWWNVDPCSNHRHLRRFPNKGTNQPTTAEVSRIPCITAITYITNTQKITKRYITWRSLLRCFDIESFFSKRYRSYIYIIILFHVCFFCLPFLLICSRCVREVLGASMFLPQPMAPSQIVPQKVFQMKGSKIHKMMCSSKIFCFKHVLGERVWSEVCFS